MSDVVPVWARRARAAALNSQLVLVHGDVLDFCLRHPPDALFLQAAVAVSRPQSYLRVFACRYSYPAFTSQIFGSPVDSII
jgi:hypothetical protein